MDGTWIELTVVNHVAKAPGASTHPTHCHCWQSDIPTTRSLGTMKTYEYSKLGLENLTLVERSVPRLAASEVVVKFHAASLNYRELLFAWGLYNPNPRLPAIPGSDGAGEVTAVGAGVTRWKIGDRVCPIGG